MGTTSLPLLHRWRSSPMFMTIASLRGGAGTNSPFLWGFSPLAELPNASPSAPELFPRGLRSHLGRALSESASHYEQAFSLMSGSRSSLLGQEGNAGVSADCCYQSGCSERIPHHPTRPQVRLPAVAFWRRRSFPSKSRL